MQRKHVVVATFAATSLLVACGGGGGGGSASIPGTPGGANPTPTPTSIVTTQPTSSITPAQTATPTTTATPTSSPATATVSGTVVDFATNTALTGVNVWTATTNGGPYTMATTTSATGAFSFTWSPGQVLYLQIGSGNTSGTQTTLHAKYAISGTTTLVVPTPQPVPNYTANAAQLSGHFRLMTLNATQTECLTAANQGRTNLSIPLLMPDEYLEELAIVNVANEVASNSDTPPGNVSNPGAYANALDMGASNYAWSTAAAGSGTCSSYTGPGYSYVNGTPPYPYASSSSYLWYGSTESPNSSGSSNNMADQYWAIP